MSASRTFRVDGALWERLEALASARQMAAVDLLAEMLAAAETTQQAAEVNAELERLARFPEAGGPTCSDMRRLEATVRGWMRE